MYKDGRVVDKSITVSSRAESALAGDSPSRRRYVCKHRMADRATVSSWKAPQMRAWMPATSYCPARPIRHQHPHVIRGVSSAHN